MREVKKMLEDGKWLAESWLTLQSKHWTLNPEEEGTYGGPGGWIVGRRETICPAKL